MFTLQIVVLSVYLLMQVVTDLLARVASQIDWYWLNDVVSLNLVWHDLHQKSYLKHQLIPRTSFPVSSGKFLLIREALRYLYAGRIHSGKHNVTVWHPSVCLSVPSAYTPWLIRGSIDAASLHFSLTIRRTDILVSNCKHRRRQLTSIISGDMTLAYEITWRT